MWRPLFLALAAVCACSPSQPADDTGFSRWIDHLQASADDPLTRDTVRRLPHVVRALQELQGEALADLLAADFVQHNPMLEGGREGLLKISDAGAQPRGGGEKLMANSAHLLVDRRHAVIHRLGQLGPLATVNFDVLRFNEFGQLAEQWHFVQPIEGGLMDNLLFSLVVPKPLDLIPAPRAGERSLTADRAGFSTLYTATRQQADGNRGLVLAYLTLLGSDPGAESDHLATYLDRDFVLHVPGVEPGRRAWLQVLERSRRPEAAPEVVLALAQNDLVWVLSRLPPIREVDVPELAVADLFRLRDQKIVEQWRVVQPSPRFSRNSNGLF